MKHTKSNKLGKDNKFFIELYPDCTTYDYNEILARLCNETVRFAYILHDKDCDDDGVIKKAHCHLFCHTENQQSISSFCAQFNISPCYVDFAISERACIRYLMHLDNNDKYQYPENEVITNYDIKKYLVDKDNEIMNCVGTIYSGIVKNNIRTFSSLLEWGLSTGDKNIVKTITNKSYMWKQIISEQHK